MVTTRITTSNSTVLKPAALPSLGFFFGKFIIFLRMPPSTSVLEPDSFPLEFFGSPKKGGFWPANDTGDGSLSVY